MYKLNLRGLIWFLFLQDSDSSFPEIEEPHRHGITVGFVSRTPSATPVSPPYRISSHHHNGREAALSGKRVNYGRDVSPIAQMSRENSDVQMNLPKTFLTRKGALMLFSAPEDEEESLTPSRSVGPRPRYMRLRKSADLIDTSLKLGTMDKLAMSVLQYGEEVNMYALYNMLEKLLIGHFIVTCTFSKRLNKKLEEPPRYSWNIVESGVKHHCPPLLIL